MMPTPNRYREIEVCGTPVEMGRQLGEAARDEIRGFCAIALERVNKTIRVSRSAALEVARKSLVFAREYASHMVDELQGMAESAGVSLDELMILQIRNQLQADPATAATDAGCTSVAFGCARGSPEAVAVQSESIVAQNWDSDPALDPFTIVLTRRPRGRPAFVNLTQAGLIAYIGFSELGMGVCLNTLPAPSRTVGVPHYFTVRAIYESATLDEAVAAVRRATRAIPANIMLFTPQGPANLEVTIEDLHVLRPAPLSGLIHTNHCLATDLLGVNEQFPELIQSHARKRRMEALLPSRAKRTPTVADVCEALRDHEDYPRSICRHPNDDPANGFWQTVFSVVMEPLEKRMHVTRGTPCDHPYETYVLKHLGE